MGTLTRRLAPVMGLLLCALPAATATAQSCAPQFGWWESPGLQPVFQSANGPAATKPCDFQVWAWTAFIHWTLADATGKPAFLGLRTPDDLANQPKSPPRERPLLLKPRVLKANPSEAVQSVQQAGPGGIVVDQNGRAVYYSTHIEPVYFSFAQKFFGIAKYKQATPTSAFPTAATVFKASWRVVQPNEDTSKLFTTTATISKLKNGPGGAEATADTIAGVKVALLGLHVVAVIKNHPEFVWSTFEHDNNAPDLPSAMTPDSPNPVSAQSYALYKGGTPAKDSNPETAQGKPVEVKVQDANMQTLAPITNVFRQFATGGALSEFATAIVSANTNFQAGVQSHAPRVNPVWANYRLVGSVWLPEGALMPGDNAMAKKAVGSTSLANSTLETYVQGTGLNCFACHNTAAGPGSNGSGTQPPPQYPGKDINLSHILLRPFFE